MKEFCAWFFRRPTNKRVLWLDIFKYLFFLLLSIVFLNLGLPLIVFCEAGDDSGSEQETDAGVGAQESSIGVRPQGEGPSNCDAGPSQREEECDLNVTPHPRDAVHELLNDLMKGDQKLDQLLERIPSLHNARDVHAWARDVRQMEQFFVETEQRLKWALEAEKEIDRAQAEAWKAQNEAWARQEAHFHSTIEAYRQLKSEVSAKLPDFPLSEGRKQYELDRLRQLERRLRGEWD